MSVYRFTRLQSHDRGDEHCSAAATAQTFFLNPRRPRSSSRPMIRNVMTASQESNGDDRSFSPCTATIRPRYYADTQQEPRAFGEYNVLHIYIINLHMTLYIATSHIGQIFCRSRRFMPITFLYIIIYAIRYYIVQYIHLYALFAHSHTCTCIDYSYTAVRRVSAIGQVQR